MMSVDNHFGLPEEVFEIILLHLALGDVLSCSLVCLGWRNAVNSDRIWEKLCRKNISEERLKLRAERKRVGSSYEVFESENLPMLCVWRRRYMDDVELKRNWKNGCFKEDFIIDYDYFSSYAEKLETDNEVLLVPRGGYYSSYTVFNIADNPIMTGEIKPALPNHIISLLKLSNNILVIVQKTLLQVYVKDQDKILKLKFLALFDRDHSETIPDTPDLTYWYGTQVGYTDNLSMMCDHNGKYFVGMYSCYYDDHAPEYSHLHIWDLEFQTKIQEVAFPREMPVVALLLPPYCLHDNIIHIALTYPSTTLIRSYDIEKSSYSETVLQLKRWFECKLLTGTVAIMGSLSEEKLLLFDLRDGRMLDTLTNWRVIEGSRVQAFGNLITYAEHAYDEYPPTVTVYDTEMLRLIDKFQVESRYGEVPEIHIVMDYLMLICTGRQLLLRDMKTREILRTVECLFFLPSDPSCSKLVVQKPDDKLVVLHFW